MDIFCGAGGLSHGFKLEGSDIRAGIDIDAACRHAYEHNNNARFIEKNVAEIRGANIRPLFAFFVSMGFLATYPVWLHDSDNARRQQKSKNTRR